MPARRRASDSTEVPTEIPAENQSPSDSVEQTPSDTSPVESVEVTPEVPQTVEHHDEEDVKSALDRDTQDGVGPGEIPESDFNSYATHQVEKKSIEEIAAEVLAGKWGSYAQRSSYLLDHGYDSIEVEKEVNRRISTGAPYSHKPSLKELGMQVLRGEWGSEEERQKRLEGAGYLYRDVMAEVNRQLGK